MPYKSDAQRRFFHAAEDRGDISSKVVNEYDAASKGMDLPEHIKKKRVMDKLKKMWRGGIVDESQVVDEKNEDFPQQNPALRETDAYDMETNEMAREETVGYPHEDGEPQGMTFSEYLRRKVRGYR